MLLRSFVVLAALAAGCSQGESRENQYATFTEAYSNGAVGNWLPDWIPRGAIDIRERHRVDVPMAWVALRFTNNDLNALGDEVCVREGVEEFSKIDSLQRERPPWWPQDLRDPLANIISEKKWALFNCHGDLMATQHQENLVDVYIWRFGENGSTE